MQTPMQTLSCKKFLLDKLIYKCLSNRVYRKEEYYLDKIP